MTAHEEPPCDDGPLEEPPDDDGYVPLHDWDHTTNPYADVPWPTETAEQRDAYDLESAGRWEPRSAPDAEIFDLDKIQARRRADMAATRADLEAAGKIMRHYTAAELVALPRRFEWLARGWLTRPTYGMIAGEKKTLKTYVSLFINLALAAGQPIFGRFDVDQAVPVISYVGEGGRVPYANRLERVARSLNIDLDNIPYLTTFEASPISSEKFQLTLRHDLEEHRPGLVTVDPLYAFHGTNTDARNLHDEGALLTSLSNPCTEANACLTVVNHFNKTGGGKGLDRITMSGAAEWVDTWTLLSHRQLADVENGRFQLLLEIGSRQWGGSTWDLDLDIGRFNPDTGEHDGDITWELHHHQEIERGSNRQADILLEIVTDMPLVFTKTEILDKAKGNRDNAREAWAELVTDGRIVGEDVPAPDARGRVKNQIRWRPAGYDWGSENAAI